MSNWTTARLRYYLASLPTLLTQINNWWVLPQLLWRTQPVTIQLRTGCRFHVRSLMDVWIVKETCLDRDYEVHSTPFEDGWTFIDIGAGIGEFALSVAKAYPHSCVYAYEPFPESFALLEANMRLNGVENVQAFQTAVGGQTGQLTLATTGAPVQHQTVAHPTMPQQTLPVCALSLDDLFQQHSLTHVDFLKIDCEGCEFETLFHASPATLAKIRHLCLEYHDGHTPHTHLDLAQFLGENRFEVKIVSNPVHAHLGLLYAYRR